MTSPVLKQPTARTPADTEATVLQRRAANPTGSSWVGASAGSGKTKVLTDRIVRLLLPQADGEPGTAPHKILALTFTKAAASEMAGRVRTRLSGWATADDDKLTGELRELLGRDAKPDEMLAARRLFAEIVDAPGGLPIMTIHAFCQSVLGRFPLEAGVQPDFSLIQDMGQAALMDEAKRTVLTYILTHPSAPEAEALFRLMAYIDEERLDSLVSGIRSEQGQLARIRHTSPSLYEHLCQTLSVPPGATRVSLLADFCRTGRADEEALRQAARLMIEDGGVKNAEKAGTILPWLAADTEERIQSYASYSRGFLTGDGTVYASLVTKKLGEAHPEIEIVLRAEADAILALNHAMAAADCARLTADLFILGEAILSEYSRLKGARGLLDFDDLILKTLALLEGRTGLQSPERATAWVMYKLDRGIDHILVDEAQDTNPEQWDVIKALAGDFFSGAGAQERNRTLFVVGDEKQSIFSFQRAAPEKFREMEDFFAGKIGDARQAFESVPMNISFRSARAVLAAVDAVFAAEDLQQKLGGRVEPHKAHRAGQPGLVELWPLFETEKEEDIDPLAPALTIRESRSGAAKLAGEIAATIKGWIGKEELPSHGRPIAAGDIMILVRTRNAFVGQLVRALKLAGVPVSGVDRMVLTDQISVQDMLSAMRFALLPEDDLSLAELLKSPLIGWDDHDLLQLAPNRDGSLWQAVKDKRGGDPAVDWLRQLTAQAGRTTAYDFCAGILSAPCPADSHSGLRAMKKRLGEEALDPIEELLNTALAYDQQDGRGLQIFLQQFERGGSEIKRQMDEGGNAVRIMTVHASKGLQAPIVFLPDTTRTAGGRQGDTLFWPDRTGQKLPYFAPDKSMAVGPVAAAKDRYAELAEAEYARLLYVAMTRAEDRLYVCGYKGTKSILEESWYHYVARAFDTLDGVEQIGDRRRYSNPASAAPDRKHTGKEAQQNAAPLPDWLFKPAPDEADPPRPLVPSKPSESEADVPSLSPLKAVDQSRFKRGNLTHKLLQIVPELPETERAAAMARYLALPAHGLPEELQQNIAAEVAEILTHPDFGAIFGAGSLAEVPVTGMLDDKTIISGQIDRMLVTDSEVLIIDFKTNRPPPTDVKDVPAVYIRQLGAYKRALQLIYPQHTIRTALLWTMHARLMEI